MTRYTVRYRCDAGRGRAALIVDDGRGAAYLFSGGQLQARLRGHHAASRLARLLGPQARCASVQEAPPYTTEELRRLAAPDRTQPGA